MFHGAGNFSEIRTFKFLSKEENEVIVWKRGGNNSGQRNYRCKRSSDVYRTKLPHTSEVKTAHWRAALQQDGGTQKIA